MFAAEVAMHGAAGSCGRPVRGVLPVPTEPDAGQLVIDWTRCQGHGLCAAVAPELIRLDDDGFPVMLNSSVPARLHGKARQAVDKCPALALRLDTGARRVPATRRERASSR